MNTISNPETPLSALGEQLDALGKAFELVVVGGSGLLALGLVERTTKDVDVVALRAGDGLVSSDPLPEVLLEASGRVARDLGLPTDWLNSGPERASRRWTAGGFVDRLERRRYGGSLTVFFASRIDQIHLKLYAVADQGAGRHLADLRALRPNRGELVLAARWISTIEADPTAVMEAVEKILATFGVEDADLRA